MKYVALALYTAGLGLCWHNWIRYQSQYPYRVPFTWQSFLRTLFWPVIGFQLLVMISYWKLIHRLRSEGHTEKPTEDEFKSAMSSAILASIMNEKDEDDPDAKLRVN